MEGNKIKKITTVDILIEKMIKNIVDDVWKIGEKIPSEIELAKTFGVNRNTLRMAIQSLNTLGLLESRVGEGTYVKQPDYAEQISSTMDYCLYSISMKNIMEFREIIETNSAMLAMERATEKEFEELKLIYNEFLKLDYKEPLSKKLLSEYSEIDFRFHEKITLMSHNEMLYYAFSMARNMIKTHMLSIGYKRTYVEDINNSINHHLELYNALIDRDKNKYAMLLNKMIYDDI